MPYLSEDRKRALDEGRAEPTTASDLDYVFATVADRFVANHGLTFEKYSIIIAALETTKLEIARRFQWYEEQKKRDNGDVLRHFDQI